MTSLYVAHWHYDGNLPAAHRWPDTDGLPVETCLRRVWVSATPPTRAPEGEPECYSGAAAYRFLLEFMTGLHSAIPGETNVLGQFRQAWFRWRTAAPAAAGSLAGTVDALLGDARRIRARHLQGVGGESYGSLVRQLVRPARSDRILIVGAGELARSIWPFFRQHAAGLWNHRSVKGLSPVWLRQFRPVDGDQAARWAQHVVLTTPADPHNDSRWMQWLQAADLATVTHLGHRRPGNFAVANAGQTFFLDQLFELRQARANVRSLQVEHARVACTDRTERRYPQDADAPHRARA
jgi:hypothetical protein